MAHSQINQNSISLKCCESINSRRESANERKKDIKLSFYGKQ